MNPEGLVEKIVKVQAEQGCKAAQRALDETRGRHGAEPEVPR